MMSDATEDLGFVGLPDLNVRLEDGVLISDAYDDIYFDRTDGLAETEYVFLQGTDLARLLRGRDHIVLAETGFGTGLNLLAACALRDKIAPNCQIDFISFEACPLTAEMIAHAHQPYETVIEASGNLCANLPPRWPGYHKTILDGGRTHLHLYYGEASAHLPSCDFKADIWFLDGFNPAKNPSLWHQDLFKEIYRCSANDARLATFTAASFVRRGLEAAGFDVQKRPGFGKKREMITAQKTAAMRPDRASFKDRTAIIIGGGIAGASLAHALLLRGITPTILEKGPQLASGASGNGAAMQSARLRVFNDAPSRLSVACLSYASRLAEQAGVVAHRGAITLNNRDKDQKRLDKLAASGWPDDLFQSFDNAQASELIGIKTDRAGDYQPASAVIKPALLTGYLANGAVIRTNCDVQKITPHAKGHQVILSTGETIAADLVFIANGASLPDLLSTSDLPEMTFQISAGQVSFWQAPTALSATPLGVNYGGYMTPVIEGLQYFGASFNRDGQSSVTQEGHHHNIALLPTEWQSFAPDITQADGRLSYRLSTKDRMPVCGALPTQKDSAPLYMMGALGARGMTNAPLLADMLVAQALDLPSGFDQEIKKALSPANNMISEP